MSENKKIYRFTAILERMDRIGGSHILQFPLDVAMEFRTNGSVRMLGKINDAEVDRALIPRGDGTHYIIVNNEMRRRIGVREGNICQVELWINENPNEVKIPEEMTEVFELEPEAKKIYDLQNPGMQRNICYWVDSAKGPDTRAKRAADMLNRLLSGSFTVGGVKGKSPKQ